MFIKEQGLDIRITGSCIERPCFRHEAFDFCLSTSSKLGTKECDMSCIFACEKNYYSNDFGVQAYEIQRSIKN
jgi:hypothetical protein